MSGTPVSLDFLYRIAAGLGLSEEFDDLIEMALQDGSLEDMGDGYYRMHGGGPFGGGGGGYRDDEYDRFGRS
jgi:hypothetical protein